MSRIFFPGCKVRARYPEASRKLVEAVLRFGFADEVTGCCRKHHQELTHDDAAVCICNNCMAMIEEDAANEAMDSIWCLIDATPDFPLPNYDGRTVTLQDCGRAYDRTDVQDSVRSLLSKMNLNVVEGPDARSGSTYCGASFLMAAPRQDAGYAPKRYVENAKERGIFKPHSNEEIAIELARHAESVACEDVACYCTACDAGLEAGGLHPVNMIELVFGEFRVRDWETPFAH